CVLFFFSSRRRHTRCLSDWSSDVCSSDLLAAIAVGVIALVWPGRTLLVLGVLFGIYLLISGVMEIVAAFGDHISAGMRVLNVIRSEERRVGKECRSRWPTDEYIKKINRRE